MIQMESIKITILSFPYFIPDDLVTMVAYVQSREY
jgi:hypothetical protein